MDRKTFLFGALASALAFGGGRANAVTKPNILFILTDDMPAHLLKLGILGPQGVQYNRAYAALPKCGPARMTFLTGLWPHQHGQVDNPGSFNRYRTNEWPRRDIFARLKGARYRIGHFGKYLNEMGTPNDPTRWTHPVFNFNTGDRWSVLCGGQGSPPSWVNVNGRLHEERTNHTPYFSGQARAFIQSWVPWACFLHLTDPHSPYTPPKKYAHTHDGERYRSPGVAETDLSDKSDWMRKHYKKAGRRLHQENYEGQSEEMELVNDHVSAVMGTLEASGQLENTLVIFTSDNGWMHGEHGGLVSKAQPYEESSRVPFVVRYPAGMVGKAPENFVSHVDVSATILHAATGNETELPGLSLFGSGSRADLLVENPGDGWYMLRETGQDGDLSYIEFPGGERELYDLNRDEWENESYYANAPQELKDRLHARLAELKVSGV